MNGRFQFPRLSSVKCLPGKARGTHAGWDEAGELVYIGLDDLTMHKAVLDQFDAEWERVFADGKVEFEGEK
jgi:hypothetical protein